MKNKKDYTGQKFNKLTIIRQFDGRRQQAECKCECGGKTSTDLSKVICGHTKSCGCIKKGLPRLGARKEYGYSSFMRVLEWYLRNAKNRGFEFLLSKEEAKLLFEGNCFYCDTPPYKIFKLPKGYGEFIYNGIDRLDNTQGYTKENSVSCCKTCNFIKNTMHVNDFIKWVRRVGKHTCDFDTEK